MKKFVKVTVATLASLIVITAATGLFYWPEIKRLQATLSVFDADKIVHNFSNMHEVFIAVPFEKAGETFTFMHAPRALPATFTHKGETKDAQELITRRATTALLVIKDDKITFEDYYLGTNDTDRRISWSVNKSIISALMGIVVGQGLVDIEKPVSSYVPSLNGSGYAGVRVKDVLQMSSGVAWDEDYSKFDSDINKMGRAIALGGSLDDIATAIQKGWEPGTKLYYVSMDTHVLAMVIRSVTQKSMPELLEEHIWSKIGVEDGGMWLTDGENVAFALGGLNIRTRDYARFGRLYLNNGNWNGEQIIPADWVQASITPDAPHIMSGPDRFGYGYQWWLGPDAREGEFVAVGVYGQYIYINQPENLVIVKNSADRGFMDKVGSMSESIQFFRAIADSLSTPEAITP